MRRSSSFTTEMVEAEFADAMLACPRAPAVVDMAEQARELDRLRLAAASLRWSSRTSRPSAPS